MDRILDRPLAILAEARGHSLGCQPGACSRTFFGSRVSRMLRRSIALLTLLLLVGSIAEPALGQLRDGVVHHESTASAASHADGAPSEHGHEDGSPLGHQHGREHQHGTSADHCTHLHGLALVASNLSLSLFAQSPDRASVARYASSPSGHFLDLFHPPRV